MFNRFKSRHHALLGVDVSAASVKILEISGNTSHHQVQAYACGLLPFVENQFSKDTKALSSTIKKLLKQGNFSTNQASIAVSDASVITKIMPIHKGLREAEIEELVSMEIAQCMPDDLHEVSMDFVVQDSTENPEMQDILVVISRSATLNHRIQALKDAGLEVKIVDVESYAIARVIQRLAPALPESKPDTLRAVIDIGAMYTKLTILQGTQKIMFTQEEEFGAKQLIEAMAQHYDIAYEKAMQRKQYYEETAEYEEMVGKPFKEAMLLHIKRILQFFYSTHYYRLIEQIVLAGWIAREKGLVEWLQEHIGIPVTLVNPFAHLSIDKSLDTDQLYNDAPSLMVACGLALRLSA